MSRCKSLECDACVSIRRLEMPEILSTTVSLTFNCIIVAQPVRKTSLFLLPSHFALSLTLRELMRAGSSSRNVRCCCTPYECAVPLRTIDLVNGIYLDEDVSSMGTRYPQTDSILYRWKRNKIRGTRYARGQRLGFELLIGSCR